MAQKQSKPGRQTSARTATTESQAQTDLVDTLANLMHYARLNKLDFLDAVNTAEGHLDAESCSTLNCMGDVDDGEGYDGYCGSCADKRERAQR